MTNWKKIDASYIYFDDNGEMYLNFNLNENTNSSVNSYVKHYKNNLKKTTAIMDEIVEEISKRVGFDVKYRCVCESKSAYYTIEIDDLFPKQEDWELLESLTSHVLLIIKFPETNRAWTFNYITDNTGVPSLKKDEDGKRTVPSKEKYLVIPNISLERFTIKDPKDLSFEELDDPNDPYVDQDDISHYLEKPTGTIGKHGITISAGNGDYVPSFYPFEFDTSLTDDKDVVIKKWKEKVIDLMVENYNTCKNILEMTKPFALEMKQQIILKRKSLQNLKNKLRIALE